MEEILMSIILFSGNARTASIQAFQKIAIDDFIGAKEKLTMAQEALCKAQHKQKLLIESTSQEQQQSTLLLMHAQDHLMNAITLQEIVEGMMAYAMQINQKMMNGKG